MTPFRLLVTTLLLATSCLISCQSTPRRPSSTLETLDPAGDAASSRENGLTPREEVEFPPLAALEGPEPGETGAIERELAPLQPTLAPPTTPSEGKEPSTAPDDTSEPLPPEPEPEPEPREEVAAPSLARELDTIDETLREQLADAADRSDAFDEDTTRLACGLVALGLLRTTVDATSERSEDALSPEAIDILTRSQERDPATRLLAAAALDRTGRIEERDAVLEALASEHLAIPAAVDSSEDQAAAIVPAAATAGAEASVVPEPRSRSTFRIENAAFAIEIRGFGNFTRRPDATFPAGDTIQVYGEFAGFWERLDVDADGPTFVRRLSASLRLLDQSENEVGRSDFLSPQAGTTRGQGRIEEINFWVRYRLPANLDPGSYRVEIRARDHESDSIATTVLELEIVGSSTPVAASADDRRAPSPSR